MGVALIGAGMIAPSHIAALGASSSATLRCILTRHPDHARQTLGDTVPADTAFTADLAAITADPTIGMAIVATPPSIRAEVIGPLVEAGKHILLEKPVARTASEAQAVVDLCDRAGVMLGVVFQHRVRPPAIAAARYVGSGALGRLGLVEISVPLWRDQSYYDSLGRGTYARDGGGVMLTNAVHSLDLALSLTGPVTRVHGLTATTPLHRMEAEDFATAGLEFACGASGSFTASTAMFPHRTEEIRLHYEKASLCFDKDTLHIHWRDGSEAVQQHSAPEGAANGKAAWHQAIIEDFINAVRSGGQPIVSGQKALASHILIEAIETSSRTGRAVDLP